ncbi:unnamed protein product [Periconia digitata]|uniref:Uncharacterized protein n=1 Tax=Periconia digitata TaxID=1303443 RepID=A0A9W4XG07_9PLEO|nr:unnamed protein product [Periconia digitata]
MTQNVIYSFKCHMTVNQEHINSLLLFYLSVPDTQIISIQCNHTNNFSYAKYQPAHSVARNGEGWPYTHDVFAVHNSTTQACYPILHLKLLILVKYSQKRLQNLQTNQARPLFSTQQHVVYKFEETRFSQRHEKAFFAGIKPQCHTS